MNDMNNHIYGNQARSSLRTRNAMLLSPVQPKSQRRRGVRILGAGLLCLTLLSGCAASLIRSKPCCGGTDDRKGKPYRATLTDLGGIPMGLAGVGESPTMAVLLPLGCLIDLPFSVAIDTVCLPADLVNLQTKSKKKEGYAKPPREQANELKPNAPDQNDTSAME